MSAFVELLPNIYQGVVMEKRVSQASVNLYIIKDQDSSLIIDSGYDSEYSNGVLQAGLEQLNIEPSKARLLITHAHQDHFGGASWCMQRGIQIFISKQEHEYLLAGDYFPLSVARMAGISEVDYYGIYDKGAKWAENACFDPAQMPCKIISSGQLFSAAEYELEVVTYKGHSREQVCLLDKRHKIMFSADQIVTGSPSVNMRPGDYGAMYQYLADLRAVRRMDLNYLLPGHGPLLSKHEGTIDLAVSNIENSYYSMLELIKNILADVGQKGCSAMEIVSYMYHKDYDSYFQNMKRSKMVMTNKVLACLEYLYESGQIGRIESSGKLVYSR